MIEVHELSKSFSGVQALDRVSFSVQEGEILGFLGPNGAGKSTTMRIITGFLPGDSGTVRVAGADVRTESVRVRQSMGYLPEGVPLYPEMRVTEYLKFRARIKQVPRRDRRRLIEKALRATDIEAVGRRIIGTLSRGYRQRVGLADALLAEPKVLILDEPTVGLDPEQVRQFRQLLKNVGADRTVVLSTHILSEVELVCSSVVIINKGTIVARDAASGLRKRFGSSLRVIAEIAAPAKDARTALRHGDGIHRVEVSADVDDGYRRFVIDVSGDLDIRPFVFETVRKHDWSLRELRSEERPLEDVFVDIIEQAVA